MLCEDLGPFRPGLGRHLPAVGIFTYPIQMEEANSTLPFLIVDPPDSVLVLAQEVPVAGCHGLEFSLVNILRGALQAMCSDPFDG